MTFKKIIRKLIIIRILIIILLLILPYYIFEGKLYIGGDDTRLFYSYPFEFFKNVTFFSWFKVSSLGINGPSQYLFPFLSAWGLLSIILPSKVALNYLAFSAPLILGFLFFQKAFKELFQFEKKYEWEILIGSLFYVLSPILIINQMFVFLISIWLLGLIPIVIYYFIRYVRTGNFKYVFIASIWCFFLAFALYAIPWLVGFIFPVFLGLIVISLLFKRREIFYFIKRAGVFFGFILATQAFWLTGFISTYFNLNQDSFASKFLSKGFVDTFTPTILSAATGNILYPLLNLFHRQIPYDFNWRLKDVFLSFYDYSFILNFIYLFIFGFGLIFYKKYLKKSDKKIFLLLLTSFVISLYFFTVNIGPLKELFIFFGKIPGFTMFRNFFDKFAPGYVILYSSLMTLSLIVVTKKFIKQRRIILLLFLALILTNALPIKETVNSPLWTTKTIYKNIVIPKEYTDFMNLINSKISSTNNILSVPFGSSVYTVIKEDNSNNVYAGVSPVKIFSGVNDISGHYSFNFTDVANVVDKLIIDRKYSQFNKVLHEHNINYILVTKNIPSELINSYLFNEDLYKVQDGKFLKEIAGEKIFESALGNYELLKAKQSNSLLNSKNLTFKKISQVKYKVYIEGISKKQLLTFLDSYHAGWKLFLKKNPHLDSCLNPLKNLVNGTTECKSGEKLFESEDLYYFLEKPIFENSQNILYNYANKWEIDPEYIKKNYDKVYFKENKDGSLDIEMILYFTPQNYFYIGVLLSAIFFLTGFIYLKFKK